MGCISRANLCPASGDTENVLLQKILQSLNEGGGGGGAGVTSLSVNGGPPQTGAVSIVTGGGGGVSSVNGDPGPAVLLDSGEITEGANLYFTEPRVRSTILTGLVIAGGAVSAADTVLSALGKYQFRIAALEAGTTGPFVLRAGDTMTGPLVISPTADDDTLLELNSFSITGITAAPAMRIVGEWNTTGAPTIIDVDVTDTASAAASNIFNFKVNTTPVFHLRKDGRLTLAGRAAFNTVSSIGHAFAATDATNTAAVLVLTLQHVLSSGTAAAGMGILLDHNIDSTTTANTRAARWITAWTDATHATRTAQTTFQSFVGGVETINAILGNGQVQGNTGTITAPSFANRNNTDVGVYFPTDAVAFSINGVALAFFNSGGLTNINTTAPVADPATAAQQWSAAGEWQYRTSTASEGSGQTNRVHNRAEEVVGAGTNYALTNAAARVDFGTTDPEIVLPTAGTYIVFFQIQFQAGATAFDNYAAYLFNSTDSAVIVSSAGNQGIAALAFGFMSSAAVVTVTASKTIQLYAYNSTAARGSIFSSLTVVRYVRLY